MGIFKKPKVLIVAGSAALLVIVAVIAVLLLQPQKTIGFFGIDQNSAETMRIQTRLEEEGYKVFFAKELDELKNANCAAWIVSAETDETAQQVVTVAEKKVIFIDRMPSMEASIRFVGYHMENAGETLATLIPMLPLGGDSNEDGSISCLLLTGPSGWETQMWQKGLDSGMSQSPLPIDILETLSTDLSEDAAKAAVAKILAKYGRDIEVILTSSEILAEGAAQAISARGWTQGEDFFLLSTGTLDKLENRSGMAFIQEEAYISLLCKAVADTISGKSPAQYLLPFRPMNNSVSLN